jgi:DNA-binding NtrC family response regulator
MNNNSLHVLLVDDDPDFIADFRALLPSDIKCHDATSSSASDDFLAQNEVDVVFLDIELGTGDNGLEYLKRLKTENPYLPVIMISAHHETHMVVKAMRLGASDYIGKSPDLDKLRISIARAVEDNRFRQKYDLMESELNELKGEMIGESDAIKRIKKEMKSIGEVRSNVLITGSRGTGKELVARGIHQLSPFSNQPFIAVNCPALTHGLFGSELFGHERGAFTDARSRREGKFELVGEGTLLLDEITEIPTDMQSKLLRSLQERVFERLGGNRLIPFKGRILASSNRNIEEAVAEGKLRADLLDRLNVTHIHLPSLCERRDDIPLLVNHYVKILARKMNKSIPSMSDEAMRLLCTYDWPGNVRELINCIENAIVHSDRDTLEVMDFSRCLMSGEVIGTYEEAKKKYMAEFQRNYIQVMLKKNDGNLSATARDMGITRQGLAKMMKSCGLDTQD